MSFVVGGTHYGLRFRNLDSSSLRIVVVDGGSSFANSMSEGSLMISDFNPSLISRMKRAPSSIGLGLTARPPGDSQGF
jgi:hypothetical protein